MSGTGIRVGGLAAGLLSVLLLSSCANRESEVLADACVKAGHANSSRLDSATLTSRCTCAADATGKYLDPDDFQLLVGVADIYNENQPDDVKLHDLVDGMVGSGLTLSKASIAAMDMMLLVHKVARECGSGPNV